MTMGKKVNKAKSIRIRGPQVGFTDLLDAALMKKQREDREKIKTGEKKRFPLRPSSAGACSRQLALQLMEYRGLAFYEDTPLMEPKVLRLLELGHSVEWRVLQSFRLLKIEQRYKQQIVELFNINSKTHQKQVIEGSCDVVFWTPKYKGVGDVKSKKDGWSNCYRSRWDEEMHRLGKMNNVKQFTETAFYADDLEAFIEELNNDFLVDNLLQINLYASSAFMIRHGINFGFLYRYNKNSSEHMEIRFRPSKRMVKRVQQKFALVSKIVDQEDVDAMVCDFPVGSMRHAFCNCHKIKPYAEHDPTKKWYETLPAKVWPKDLARLSGAKELKRLFDAYLEGRELIKTENQIVQMLLDQKCKKVRLPDDQIFEIKYLKSPRPHYELRQSKL